VGLAARPGTEAFRMSASPATSDSAIVLRLSFCPQGCGFVQFLHRPHAEYALQEMNGWVGLQHGWVYAGG
jgi:hypothetical protein